MKNSWVRLDVIYNLLGPEPAILLLLFCGLTWGFYKLLLKGLSEERHKSLNRQYKNIWTHLFLSLLWYVLFIVINEAPILSFVKLMILPYLGVLTVFWSMIVIIKTSRILILQYLFLGSMRTGVPLLVVNILSLTLSVALFLWFLNTIFGIRLLPLVATSAVFSVIVGLALQETLGNLFAAVAMQFDKPYEIGEWIEVYNGTQKIVGLVEEITWRSTLLIGWTDEFITVPNRVMAQAHIANFTKRNFPFIKSQFFRLHYSSDINQAKDILIKMTSKMEEIAKNPKVMAVVSESSESWIGLRLIFSIYSYSRQNIIADQVFIEGWEKLKQAGFVPAKNQIEVIKENI